MRSALAAAVALVLCAAPAAAEADLSGFWAPSFGDIETDAAMMAKLPPNTVVIEDTFAPEYPRMVFGGLRLTPEALAHAEAWEPEDEMTLQKVCSPPSIVYSVQGPFPFEIDQTAGLIAFRYEYYDQIRLIFMDGRGHPPADAPHTKMGHSIGRWEGDELVVDSTGFKDTTWLDFGGHPHSESLRITERYRRTDFGHIRRQVTLSDPAAFGKPIVVDSDLTLNPDTELLEYVCAETPRDRFLLVGRSEAEKQVRVAPEVLDKYVGDYDFEGRNTFGIRTVSVTRAGGQLFMDFNGKGRTPLVPLSQNMFSPRLLGTYEFVTDESGAVTHVMVHGVEGTEKAVRRSKAGRL
jgi:hypothetical protein